MHGIIFRRLQMDFLALRMTVYNAAHTLTHGFYHAL
nr:MAG TPA: hypothetical protein [Caudoviricetes sp.]